MARRHQFHECPRCGYFVDRLDAVICPECGADLIEESRKPLDDRPQGNERFADWEPLFITMIAFAIGGVVVCLLRAMPLETNERMICVMAWVGVGALSAAGLRERWRERMQRPRLISWLGITGLIAVPCVLALMLLLSG